MATDVPLTEEQLAILRSNDTPTVCNVIELFGIRHDASGYMNDRIRAVYPEFPPMVGYAVTATFQASSRPDGAPASYQKLIEIINLFNDLPGPPVLVFQDLDKPTVAATYGDMMVTAFKSFGAVGLVTSGAGRDIEQVRAMDFPCFTSGMNCSHGRCTIMEVGVPVTVGGCLIRTGDLLHGDGNGVTTIPNQIASQVSDNCQSYVGCENIFLDYLRSTASPTTDGLRKAGGDMSARMAELRQKVAATKCCE